MTGIEAIAAERQRQMEREGWSAEHDDEHTDKSLALVAALYAIPHKFWKHDPWPWDSEWDKREKHSYRRRLEIAGALLAAELDRLNRLAHSKER